MKANFDHLLLHETPDAAVITKTDGEVVYWNKGAETIFGYTSAEAVGRPLYAIVVPPDQVEEERRFLQEAIQAGLAVFETICRRKDGSLVYVDVSSKAIRNPQGEVEFILSSKRDVTGLRALRDSKLVEAKFRG